MADPGGELLREHYADEHLAYEQLRDLGPSQVIEAAQVLGDRGLRGNILRLRNRDEASGYIAIRTNTTRGWTSLCHVQVAT